MIERARIEAVLDRIRPLLQADGANVELVDVREDGASVRFTGLCGQCGTAPLTLHSGLSDLLREEIPDMARLRRMMTARKLPQVQAARWFHVSQPRVSHLVNDRANRFSTDTLFNMLEHAGVRVSVDFKDGSAGIVVAHAHHARARLEGPLPAPCAI
jgi:Fe-S cluster biogenesis protein NfuA